MGFLLLAWPVACIATAPSLALSCSWESDQLAIGICRLGPGKCAPETALGHVVVSSPVQTPELPCSIGDRRSTAARWLLLSDLLRNASWDWEAKLAPFYIVELVRCMMLPGNAHQPFIWSQFYKQLGPRHAVHCWKRHSSMLKGPCFC